jgi:hypothetical protein
LNSFSVLLCVGSAQAPGNAGLQAVAALTPTAETCVAAVSLLLAQTSTPAASADQVSLAKEAVASASLHEDLAGSFTAKAAIGETKDSKERNASAQSVADVASILGFQIPPSGSVDVVTAVGAASVPPLDAQSVRSRVADELLQRIAHWSAFTAERQQFREAVEEWRLSASGQTLLSGISLASTATALHACIVLLGRCKPFVRVFPPSHGPLQQVIWIGMDDVLPEPRFCPLQPLPDVAVKHEHLVLLMQTGAASLLPVCRSCSCHPRAHCSCNQTNVVDRGDLDAEGDAKMSASEGKAAKSEVSVLGSFRKRRASVA